MRLSRIIKTIIIFFILVILAAYGAYRIARSMYPLKYKESIKSYSEQYGLDPYLVAAVINAESKFDANAKSHKDAYGLMQITPSTADWAAGEMKVNNFEQKMLYDPDFNIKMGCWYLSNLKTEFKDFDLVLAAYNGGRGNVRKWLNDSNYSKNGESLHYIPFKETDQYVKRVKTNYNIYKFLYSKEMQ